MPTRGDRPCVDEPTSADYLAVNEPPAVLGRDIIYCRIPVSDDGANNDDIVATAIECLCSFVRRDHRTLVAGSAAVSRSPMITAAAVSILSGNSLTDSLIQITANAPHDVSPTVFSSSVSILRWSHSRPCFNGRQNHSMDAEPPTARSQGG